MTLIKPKLWVPRAPAILRIVPRENALLLRHRRIMDALRDPDMTPEKAVGMFPFLWPSAVTITPGSTTFDSGSGNFTVQPYNTLVVEVWGAGASGSPMMNAQPFKGAAVAGGNSSVSTLSLTANGGNGTTAVNNTIQQNGGTGGTAAGGDTNTTGGTGGIGPAGSSSTPAGAGGNGANGGAGGAAVNIPAVSGLYPGNPGNAPGGAGSGCGRAFPSGELLRNSTAGGGGGAYCSKTYTFGVTAGYPAYGALLAYIVGAMGTATGTLINGANGSAGRVRFTWS